MERKIGEVFTYKNLKLVTVEDLDVENCCDSCVIDHECIESKCSNVIGYCSAQSRADNKNICFHKAGQEAQGFRLANSSKKERVKVVTYCEQRFLVSDFVKYMATDVNGDIFGYSTKPTLIGDTWRKTSSSCKCEFIANINFIGSCSESLRDVTE